MPLDHVFDEILPFDDHLEYNNALLPQNCLFNVTRWASLNLPVDGPIRSALPGSVQLSVRSGTERLLLAAAAAIGTDRVAGP